MPSRATSPDVRESHRPTVFASDCTSAHTRAALDPSSLGAATLCSTNEPGLSRDSESQSTPWHQRNPVYSSGVGDEDCPDLLQWLLGEPAAQTAIPNFLADDFDMDIQAYI
jgi:hypothetical protein